MGVSYLTTKWIIRSREASLLKMNFVGLSVSVTVHTLPLSRFQTLC